MQGQKKKKKAIPNKGSTNGLAYLIGVNQVTVTK